LVLEQVGTLYALSVPTVVDKGRNLP
jgi:hypothetical protein